MRLRGFRGVYSDGSDDDEGIWVSDSVVVLVCAVGASLASGVLVAYGVCVAMFRVFQVRAQQAAVASERTIAVAARIVEG